MSDYLAMRTTWSTDLYMRSETGGTCFLVGLDSLCKSQA